MSLVVIVVASIFNLFNYEEILILLFMIVGFCVVNNFKFKVDGFIYLRAIMSGISSYLIVKIATLITETIVINIYKFSGTGVLSNGEFTWGTTIMCIIIMLLVSFITAYYMRKIIRILQRKTGLSNRNYSFVIIPFIFTTASIYIVDQIFTKANVSLKSTWLVFLFLLIMLVIAIFSVIIFFNSILKEQKIKNDKENYKNLELYMNSLESNYNEVRKFRHDIKNVLLSLNVQIKENGSPQLIENTEEILSEYNFDMISSNRLNGFQFIQNSFIKGLVFSKFLEAQNQNIEFNLEVNRNVLSSSANYFNEFRVLGILLDNALEAGKNNGRVTLGISESEKMIEFFVINNLADKEVSLADIDKKGYSTKGENRGLGLSTAREIISENNNMFLNFKINDGQFVANFMINKE